MCIRDRVKPLHLEAVNNGGICEVWLHLRNLCQPIYLSDIDFILCISKGGNVGLVLDAHCRPEDRMAIFSDVDWRAVENAPYDCLLRFPGMNYEPTFAWIHVIAVVRSTGSKHVEELTKSWEFSYGVCVICIPFMQNWSA